MQVCFVYLIREREKQKKNYVQLCVHVLNLTDNKKNKRNIYRLGSLDIGDYVPIRIKVEYIWNMQHI